MRLVLDTNVVISALVWGGLPYQLLQAAAAGTVDLYTAPVLLDELQGVLARVHLALRLERQRRSVDQAVEFYAKLCLMIAPQAIPRTSRDPDDDAVLACALAARADLIVSGDQDLLVLQAFQGIPILSAGPALARLGIPAA